MLAGVTRVVFQLVQEQGVRVRFGVRLDGLCLVRRTEVIKRGFNSVGPTFACAGERQVNAKG